MIKNSGMFQATVKDHSFKFGEDAIKEIDIIRQGVLSYHLIKDHVSVKAVISKSTADSKTIIVQIDGELFTVTIKDELDQMLDKMGFGMAANKQIKEIKAPMPGLVLEINVQAGNAVTQGSKLLILEAMKMENSIIIPVDATIKRVNVTKGQAVEKGQVLVELE